MLRGFDELFGKKLQKVADTTTTTLLLLFSSRTNYKKGNEILERVMASLITMKANNGRKPW